MKKIGVIVMLLTIAATSTFGMGSAESRDGNAAAGSCSSIPIRLPTAEVNGLRNWQKTKALISPWFRFREES